ncbi:MAG: hypothetical protein RLZZ157_1905 [Pseudomonadota bacterium]|jgi:23S rRNA (cytidine1920-2'-O)/16S rRNA (cytidine1409-2'-O)-methyltransferase
MPDTKALVRADVLLVARGLMPTRAKARTAIEAGLVTSQGQLIAKPAQMLAPDCPLQASLAHPWVSRAALKLIAALDQFAVSVTDRFCLDIGASTGGFTQVLLARGARHVVAVDVGRDQLDKGLAADPRVTPLEGQDARTLTRDDLGQLPPDLVVMDVSFIGIEKILPHVLTILPAHLDLIALVKPQFQAGPARVGKRGIVAADTARLVAEEVSALVEGLGGLHVLAMTDSPITGSDGNHEFLLHARR